MNCVEFLFTENWVRTLTLMKSVDTNPEVLPLTFVCSMGHDILEKYIGMFILHFAIIHENIPLIRLIIQKGADLTVSVLREKLCRICATEISKPTRIIRSDSSHIQSTIIPNVYFSYK